MSNRQAIIVEERLPHAPATIWKALTTPALMARWMHMPMSEFHPTQGHRFTFHTTPAGAWDGTIDCEVLEAVPNERLVFSWKSGDAGNEGYGTLLDTVVTFTLTPEFGGTRLRLVHDGFDLPRNDLPFRNMGNGWRKIVPLIGGIAADI